MISLKRLSRLPAPWSTKSPSTSKNCRLSKVTKSINQLAFPHFALIGLTCLFVTDVDCSKWHILYLAKLKACHRIADFSDVKKDVELKEQKKECLIEIIDVLDEPEAAEYIIKERVLDAAMQMISANLFRTFANKSKLLTWSN